MENKYNIIMVILLILIIIIFILYLFYINLLPPKGRFKFTPPETPWLLFNSIELVRLLLLIKLFEEFGVKFIRSIY